MLEEIRVDLDGAGVQPGLVGEGRGADVGLPRVGRDVRDLRDRVRDSSCLGESGAGEPRIVLLQFEVRDDRHQVGVPGPLAVTVQRPLYVQGTGVDRGERVRDRTSRVVVTVDAHERTVAAHHRDDVTDHIGQLTGQHAAVRVAERHHLDTGLGGSGEDLQRVRAIGEVTVEEVLRVEEHPAALGAQEGDRVGHHREVLLERGAQGAAYVAVVTLPHERDDRRARVQQRQHLRVLGRTRTGTAGGAEGGERGVAQRQFVPRPREELGVTRVRARPATFDEADAELVEVRRDRQLVVHRQVETLLLGAVAQRRVVDVEGARRSVATGRRGCRRIVAQLIGTHRWFSGLLGVSRFWE